MFAASVIFGAWSVRPASAQEADMEAFAAAVQQAKEAYTSGDFPAAITHLQRANMIQPDARLMLAVMASGRLYISASAKDERDWVRLRQGAPATCIKLSPKQDLFAIGREDRTVDIARVGEPKQARLSFNLPDVPRRLAFSEDGYLLSVLFEDQSLGLYQVINGMNLLTMDSIAGARLLDVFFSVKLNNIMGYILQDGVLHARTLQPTAGR